MAFTTEGLNELLEGLKANFTNSVGMLVAKDQSDNYIAAVGVQFDEPSNGTMDLDTSQAIELTIPAGNEVGSLALYTGQISDQQSMDNATELVSVSFSSGTYNFVNAGTLTVTSYEISVAE